MARKAIDITGKRYGRLVVIKQVESDKQQNAQWLCQCDCGKQKIIRGKFLRSGKITSCGCILSEASKDRMTKLLTKHGMSSTKLYKVFISMHERCEKHSSNSYHRYGGRGIKICDEWKRFEPFYEWAMANGYKEGLQIDRINNDGNYEPSNCRWVTLKDNARNTSKCIPVIATNCETGEEILFRSINEAAEKTGICQTTIKRFLKGQRTRQHKFSYKKGVQHGTKNPNTNIS